MMINLSASPSVMTLKRIDHSDPELRQLRQEVTRNLALLGRREFPEVTWRSYRIRPGDSFFKVMARSMLNHDTLSSVNLLASMWDLRTGDIWLLPNVRGLAVSGDPDVIARKYHIPESALVAVPGKKLWFIPGGKFDVDERRFMDLSVFLFPIEGKVTSGFGMRRHPVYGKPKWHKGIDIACKTGDPVLASLSGTVAFAGEKSGYGLTLVIEHANNHRTLYGHLSQTRVSTGEIIKTGERIGDCGSSGISTGPHLHFEVHKAGKPRPPLPHLRHQVPSKTLASDRTTGSRDESASF